jgi:hypothetical protein
VQLSASGPLSNNENTGRRISWNTLLAFASGRHYVQLDVHVRLKRQEVRHPLRIPAKVPSRSG